MYLWMLGYESQLFVNLSIDNVLQHTLPRWEYLSGEFNSHNIFAMNYVMRSYLSYLMVSMLLTVSVV